MEIKRNESTINRPEGDRVIDASFVFVDTPDYIRQLKDENAWDKNDRNGFTVFKSPHLTIVVTALKKNAEISNNNVDGYLTVQVLKGKLQVATVEGDMAVEEMQEIAFHPNVEHSMKAISDSIIQLRTYRNIS
jgi:quercetin dioxygenase-like cupin family protein